MSRLDVNSIRHTAGSADNITLDGSKNVTCENNLQVDGNVTVTGTLPADKLTGTLPAISGASLTNLPAAGVNPNLLINGAMSVAQRAPSATGITTSGYYCLDRWTLNLSNYGTWLFKQTTGAPAGFGKILEVECSTADASPAAGDDFRVMQRIEAYTLQHLKYGDSGAQDITLSFWNACNQASKVVAVHIYQPDGSRHVTKTFTTNSSAGTWQKTTLTFPGDTGGTITNGNGAGLEVQFYMGGGSSFTGGSANTTWSSYTAANTAAGQTLMLGDTVNNYFRMTGVKLEVGTSATTFEDNDIGNEIWRCRRYCQGSYADDNDFLFGPGFEGGAGSFYLPMMFNPPMRAAPTMKVNSQNWKQVGQGGQSSEYTGAMTAYDQQPGPLHTALLFWKDTDYPSSKEGRTQWIRAGDNGTSVTIEAEI